MTDTFAFNTYSNLKSVDYDYTKPINMDTELKEKFNKNIYSALQEAMSIKTDDMEIDDFKNLVLFILNVKCGVLNIN